MSPEHNRSWILFAITTFIRFSNPVFESIPLPSFESGVGNNPSVSEHLLVFGHLPPPIKIWGMSIVICGIVLITIKNQH